MTMFLVIQPDDGRVVSRNRTEEAAEKVARKRARTSGLEYLIRREGEVKGKPVNALPGIIDQGQPRPTP